MQSEKKLGSLDICFISILHLDSEAAIFSELNQ